MLTFYMSSDTGEPMVREVTQEEKKVHGGELLLSMVFVRAAGTQLWWRPLGSAVESALEFCLSKVRKLTDLLTVPFVIDKGTRFFSQRNFRQRFEVRNY